MAASLLRGLKLDFGLKCHFNRNILPSASNSVFKLCLIYWNKSKNKIKSF